MLVVNIGIIITSTWGKDGLADKDLGKANKRNRICGHVLDHSKDFGVQL